MTPLVQKVVAHLKKERILPSPGWHFSAIRFFWCSITGLILVFCVLLTALALHLTFETDWLLLLGKGLGPKALASFFAPVFWLFLLSSFIFIATYCFRKINRGYRYAFLRVALIFFLLSFLLASALEFSPLDNPLEGAFLQWASPQNFLRDVLK